MGFSNRFAGGKGGKKGPRAHNGSTKAKGVKLRPQPQKPSATVASRSINDFEQGREQDDEDDDDENGDDQEEEDEDDFSYANQLKASKKPLEGCQITVSGCKDTKLALLEMARELGATTSDTMTNNNTHLITDALERSRKLEMAYATNMKVMLPSWLQAVRDAWTSAEDVDFSELSKEHELPLFHNFHVSVTGFARGPHKDNIIELLSSNGALVSTGLHVTSTHLIVASPNSPHSPTGLQSKKLDQAESMILKGGCNLKIVWEGWVNEAVEKNAMRTGRDEVWKWTRDGVEPTRVEWVEDEFGEETSFAVEEMKRRAAGGSDRKEKEIEVVRKKKVTQESRNQAGEVDEILMGYVAEASTSASQIHRRKPTLLAKSSDPEMLPPLPQITKSSKGKGKQRETDVSEGGGSIIKALSNSRSNSFRQPPPLPPKPFSSATISSTTTSTTKTSTSTSKPLPPLTDPSDLEATAADDSGFLEATLVDEPESYANGGEEGEGEMIQYFDGLNFLVVETGLEQKAVDAIKKAILEHGGAVQGVDEETADWIVVPFFDAETKYLNSDDTRVVTGGWIEQCVFHDVLIPVGQGLLDRPLGYRGPVPGAEALSIHTSGFSDLTRIHIKRLVEYMGGSFHENLDRQRSHLIHAGIDDPSQGLEGQKIVKANAWNIPIVGLSWLRDWGLKNALPLPSIEEEVKDEDKADDDVVKVLEGCVVGFGNKFKSDHKDEIAELTKTLEASGAGVDVAGETLTHIIHIGPKPAVVGKEFKTLSETCFIVHPKWVEESIKAGHKLSEGDYPHTYDPKKSFQLSSFVTSPPKRQPSLRLQSPRKRTASTTSNPPPDAKRHRSISAVLEDTSTSTIFGKEFRHSSVVREMEEEEEMRNAIVKDDEDDTDEEDTTPFALLARESSSVPPQDSSPDNNRSLLRQQTEAMLLDLKNEEPVNARRKNRAGSARAKTVNPHPVPVALPPSGPRRIPGLGYEQSQFTQTDEFSMDVTFQDPKAAKAFADIQAALNGNGNNNNVGTTEVSEKRAREEEEAIRRDLVGPGSVRRGRSRRS